MKVWFLELKIVRQFSKNDICQNNFDKLFWKSAIFDKSKILYFKNFKIHLCGVRAIWKWQFLISWENGVFLTLKNVHFCPTENYIGRITRQRMANILWVINFYCLKHSEKFFESAQIVIFPVVENCRILKCQKSPFSNSADFKHKPIFFKNDS